jgi:hypothetical protein
VEMVRTKLGHYKTNEGQVNTVSHCIYTGQNNVNVRYNDKKCSSGKREENLVDLMSLSMLSSFDKPIKPARRLIPYLVPVS